MPIYLYAATALAAVALGAWTGWTARDWKADADAAKVQQAAWDASRKADRAFTEAAARVDEADAKRRLAADAARARDRDALERVRIAAALAGRRPTPAAACAPVEEQFAACRGALERSAATAARGADLVRDLANDHAGLAERAAEVK